MTEKELLDGFACYKCGTNHELSLKGTTKKGTKRYLCRPCRREQYYKYSRLATPPTNKGMDKQSMKRWEQLAKATVERISKKYV